MENDYDFKYSHKRESETIEGRQQIGAGVVIMVVSVLCLFLPEPIVIFGFLGLIGGAILFISGKVRVWAAQGSRPRRDVSSQPPESPAVSPSASSANNTRVAPAPQGTAPVIGATPSSPAPAPTLSPSGHEYTFEQKLCMEAYANGWELEFHAEIGGTQVFQLNPQEDPGRGEEYRISREGTVWTGYGEQKREMSLTEFREILRTPPPEAS